MICRFERFLKGKGRKIAEKPESSVGLSEHSTRSLSMHRLRRSGLHNGALACPPFKKAAKDAPMVKLGKRIASFHAVCIPAEEGHPPDIVKLDTFKVNSDYYKCDDLWMLHVPDFSVYWGETYNFDRAVRQITATDQNPPSSNADYHMWWNTNDSLPPNGNLTKILGLTSVPFPRQF